MCNFAAFQVIDTRHVCVFTDNDDLDKNKYNTHKIMKKYTVFLLMTALLTASCKKGPQGMPDADNHYAVISLQPSQTELTVSYPATLRGIQDVEIRPKVSGFITRIYVQEGQSVGRGQALFTIDSEQFQAAVRQAQEGVQAAQQQINVTQSNIATAELTLQNKKMLFEKNIISEYEYRAAENQLQSLKAQLGSAKAQLGSAQAQLAAARDNLSYCTVTSPTNGVIGMLPLKVGALVGPSMVEPFTTVSNIGSVYAYFSMTEKQLLEMARTGKGGVQEALRQMPAVKLRLADGSSYSEQGKVDAVGGVIDNTTGSVQMRATFPNPHRLLRSGGTANIQMPSFVASAILVPQSATIEIQNKKFVYVVGKDNKVATQEITVESQSDGTNYVVTKGLKSGDRIVVEGVQTLKNGFEIQPITPAEAAQMRQKAAQDVKDGKLPI